jgi:hypothetical protein
MPVRAFSDGGPLLGGGGRAEILAFEEVPHMGDSQLQPYRAVEWQSVMVIGGMAATERPPYGETPGRRRRCEMRGIDTLVIHHSGGAIGSVAVFRREHMAPPLSWHDIGYHEVIGNGRGMLDGHIGQGRPHSKTGAGVWGANVGKLHVCLVGNFERGDAGYWGPPTLRQMNSLGHWLAVNAVRYEIRDAARVVGHREIAVAGHETLCPGSEMPLGRVREWFELNRPLFAVRRQKALGEWLRSEGVRLKASLE